MSLDTKKATDSKFEWDFDVPNTPFWQGMDFRVARNFLVCYIPDELEAVPFDAALSIPDRLSFLLDYLQSRLAAREATAAPQPLHVNDPDEWRRVLLGIQTMQSHLNLTKDEAWTIRRMLETTTEGFNVRMPWPNMLAALDLKNGDFAGAEKVAREVLPWMQSHEKLGVDSPQAFGTTRTIIEAAWRQGGMKKEEARWLIEETSALIEGMGADKFGKYQDDERQMLQDLTDKLEAC